MNQTCSKCNYWESESAIESNNVRFATCGNPKIKYNNTDRNLPNNCSGEELFYEDSDGFAAPPWMGELFGCVHWEAKS
ncbi:MAG: hypothetical protein AN483_06830 [Aphanizomenon flos-aquae MDT14a]|jgi:hypothetical protein|uniref:Uncharacterized protein n=1 Tax=Aphanizomenon flos-aquae WA102 TaxID=1710896 RepID=A0A1B7WS81_APHFL|nr:MAG: hypothetical protein AN483_06830 [Aphanizomenon flos-aquae MDT14a]OBQ39974.1 MAG: hypothetical protein AN484_22830 [Aphanizomenon flos-aquae WA102]